MLQATRGAPTSKRDFEVVLGAHFGDISDDLRAKLFTSHHHLYEGKYAKETKQEKAIAINLTFGDATHVHVVSKNASLRDVQKDVCRMFHQRFPAKKARLIANGANFDEFIHQPFHRSKEGDIVTVLFSDTDDPYFYDLFDRKGSKLKLEEEIALEKVPPLVL